MKYSFAVEAVLALKENSSSTHFKQQEVPNFLFFQYFVPVPLSHPQHQNRFFS